MICSSIKTINDCLKELEPKSIMLMGNSYGYGLTEVTLQTVAATAKTGSKVVYFIQGYRIEKTRKMFEEIYHVNNIDNIILEGKGTEDDGYSYFSTDEIEERLKNIKDYDLVVIDDIRDFIDSETNEATYSLLFTKLSKVIDKFNVPFICTINCINYVSNRNIEEEKRDVEDMYEMAKDYVSFILYIGQREPSEINIKVLDCRIKETNEDYLYDPSKSELYLIEGKLKDLYNKALSLGLSKPDARDYALYWKNKKEFKEDENIELSIMN